MPAYRKLAVAGLCLAAGSQVALAADPAPTLLNPAPASGWIVTLGGSGQYGPKYDGAKSYGLSGTPSLSWRRVGEPEGFSAPDEGLDFALFETSRFSIGVVGDLKSGRYSGSDRKLFGMRDVPWTIEAGAFAEFWPIEDRLRTRIEVRQGFHGHHGIVADIFVDWVQPIGRFTLSGGPRLSFGNQAYMRRNFGVTPEESLANGILAAYSPSGGVKSAGLAAALEYAWSEVWKTTAYARYDRLLQEAARSPIVRTIGQRDQFSFGLSTTYSFKIGG
ncbi:MipA/OmpV family protein [Bosea sp. BIWAKO-01]|uniref:MipA/OmpV family protein n=1 Tax=Bosea sp. BIWAKO-01 TaxID=506668 RepID=UPI00086F05B9|nr:MipA/OmpV family protein [Bosea sp. BIWAKO-01]GAU83164.1 hypothetical protein V [Bosea sp. BIWAKO-01]